MTSRRIQRFSDAERLRSIRRLFRRRERAPAGRETAYSVYVLILATAVAGVPVARLLFEAALHVAEAADWQSDVGHAVGLSAGLLLVGAIALGGTRGPVISAPFRVWVLVSIDVSRSRTLQRIFIPAAIATVGPAVVIATLVSFAFAVAAVAEPIRLVWCVALSGIYAVILCVAWLLGQRLGAGLALGASGVVLFWVVLSVVHSPTASLSPWGWLGQAWDVVQPLGPSSVIPLLACGVAALVAVPWFLGRLRGPDVVDQALRWDVARSAAASADLTVAADLYRARPHIGRTWRAVTTSWIPLRFIGRDIIGALRTPGRFTVGVVLLIASGMVMGAAMNPGLVPNWILAGIGAALCLMATGVFSDGFRHVAHAASSPPLYAYSIAQLSVLHAAFPLMVTVAGLYVGVLLMRPDASVAAAWAVVGLGVFVTTLRIYVSAKSSPSPALFQPVPTPFGDLSGVVVLLWQVDGLVIAAGGAALGVYLAGPSMVMLAGFFIAFAGIMLAASVYRIRRLN